MVQKYREEYSKKYNDITASRKSVHHARCTLCSVDFSIKHSGGYDIVEHQKSRKHMDMVKVRGAHKPISASFNSSDKMEIRAECHMAIFLVEHNLPISTSDHLSPLMGVMFPMCQTAKNFSYKHTKTAFIIKEMASSVKEDIVREIKGHRFSILTDGSADKGSKKQLYPFLVKYFNKELGRIVTEVLAIPAIEEDSTGANIFHLLDAQMTKFGLVWDEVSAFCSDNANVMMGKNNGVVSSILKTNANIMVCGCLCHLVAIAARNAAKQLPIHIEDTLLDIMYHLKGSSKRNRQFREVQEACGLDAKGLLAYCPTRWLSLGQCIPRILENLVPLKVVFGKDLKDDAKSTKRHAIEDAVSSKRQKVEEKAKPEPSKTSSSRKLEKRESSEKAKPETAKASSSAREKHKSSSSKSTQKEDSKKKFSSAGRENRIYTAISDPNFVLYCTFLKSNLKLFDTFNLLLQQDEPCVHILRTKCVELLTDLYVKFVKVSAIRSASDIFQVDFKVKENQKNDSDLVVGGEVRTLLADIDQKAQAVFYLGARGYFVEACSYILQKFPLQEEWMKHAEVVDIGRRGTAQFESVCYFVEKMNIKCDVDVVEHEFLRYQVDKLELKAERIDEKWGELMQKYPNLSEVMLAVLTIPHGNADSERIFSAVRHVDTDFRQSLSVTMMDALMVVKRHLLVRNEVCHTYKFKDDFLVKAKSATYNGLKKANAETDDEITGPDVSGMVMRMLEGGDKSKATNFE